MALAAIAGLVLLTVWWGKRHPELAGKDMTGVMVRLVVWTFLWIIGYSRLDNSHLAERSQSVLETLWFFASIGIIVFLFSPVLARPVQAVLLRAIRRWDRFAKTQGGRNLRAFVIVAWSRMKVLFTGVAALTAGFGALFAGLVGIVLYLGCALIALIAVIWLVKTIWVNV